MQAFLERLAAIWQPHEGQREFLLHPAKTKVLACGRRWGKTDACAVQVLAAMLGDPNPPRPLTPYLMTPPEGATTTTRVWPTRHLILAPTLDQARLLFDRVVQLLTHLLEHERNDAPGPEDHSAAKRRGRMGRESGAESATINLDIRTSPYPRLKHEGHTVMARSGHIGRALRGNEATHIVVDEAAYVPEELITEVAMPMLATNDGWLTLISTPHGKNHFWRFFKMGERGEHGIWSRTAPSSESPLVSRAFLEVQRELISERAFAVEYEANFLDSEGRVFRTEAVESCLVPRFHDQPRGQIAIGVDWGKYEDYTAVVVVCGTRQEARLVELDRFHHLSWGEQVAQVAEIIRRYPNSRVTCDGTGAGDPLVDDLKGRELRSSIEGFTFSWQSKAKLIDNLVWMVDNATLKMTPEPELLREMQHFESRPMPSGRTQMSARGGYHDDLVIALALAAHGLNKGAVGTVRVGGKRDFHKGITNKDGGHKHRFQTEKS